MPPGSYGLTSRLKSIPSSNFSSAFILPPNMSMSFNAHYFLKIDSHSPRSPPHPLSSHMAASNILAATLNAGNRFHFRLDGNRN